MHSLRHGKHYRERLPPVVAHTRASALQQRRLPRKHSDLEVTSKMHSPRYRHREAFPHSVRKVYVPHDLRGDTLYSVHGTLMTARVLSIRALSRSKAKYGRESEEYELASAVWEVVAEVDRGYSLLCSGDYGVKDTAGINTGTDLIRRAAQLHDTIQEYIYSEVSYCRRIGYNVDYDLIMDRIASHAATLRIGEDITIFSDVVLTFGKHCAPVVA